MNGEKMEYACWIGLLQLYNISLFSVVKYLEFARDRASVLIMSVHDDNGPNLTIDGTQSGTAILGQGWPGSNVAAPYSAFPHRISTIGCSLGSYQGPLKCHNSSKLPQYVPVTLPECSFKSNQPSPSVGAQWDVSKEIIIISKMHKRLSGDNFTIFVIGCTSSKNFIHGPFYFDIVLIQRFGARWTCCVKLDRNLVWNFVVTTVFALDLYPVDE